MTGRRRMLFIGLGGLLIAGVSGCGPDLPPGSPAIVVRSSTRTTSPSSPPPVSSAASSTGSPSATLIGHWSLMAPSVPPHDVSPVPLSFHGLTQAAASQTIAVSYPFAHYYTWQIWSIALWDYGNPGGSYATTYWGTNASGAETFVIPMALQNTRDRIIVQFLGPQGQLVTETSPVFVIH